MTDATPTLRSRRTVVTAAIASIGLTGAGYPTLASQHRDENTNETTSTETSTEDTSDGNGETESGATVMFTDQPTDGMSVVIDSVTLPDGGFVAIHDETLLTENDPVGSVIGVSAFLGAGDHENIEVALFDDVPGAEFEQDSLEENRTLIAMLHVDTNSSEVYEFVTNNGQEDGPYTEGGEAIVDDACVQICKSS